MSIQQESQFFIGQIIKHNLLHYRGVIIDVDFQFLGTAHWYRKISLDRPDKKQPWYHILVDNASHQAYAPENQLEACTVREPINHPLIELYFLQFDNGIYEHRRNKN
ncbi:MAG: heat shock protein HspQ [Methylococcales bacterium]